MQHIYRIKSSQTWTCPKAGAWKVICVGGGASGGVAFGGGIVPLQQAGGTTSFGSLLSASGGEIAKTTTTFGNGSYNSVGGYGGWDGINYGGSPGGIPRTGDPVMPPSGNGGIFGDAGLGYGAGGGMGMVSAAMSFSYASGTLNLIPIGVSGKPGEMTDGIFDLTLNQSIACTIGTSNKPTINDTSLLTLAKKTNSSITSVTKSLYTEISQALTTGTSGIIYLEYLG